MPPSQNPESASDPEETKESHVEISAVPKLEDAFATTLAMLQSLPDSGVHRAVPQTSSKDQTWMLHPSLEKLLSNFRDEILTRFYPNASKEKAEAETAFIFNQIAPLLQRVPPADPKDPQVVDVNNHGVHQSFSNKILSMIKNFVNESGEEFLKRPHHKSAAHQVDFWKLVAIQKILNSELNCREEKGLIAIYDAWERQSQECANSLRFQCLRLIREKEEMEEELKRLTARCGFLEKMQSKTVEEQVKIQVKCFLQAHAALEKKCKKFAIVNKDINKYAMFLTAKSHKLIQGHLQSAKLNKELIEEYNTLGCDYNRVTGINKLLLDRLLHAHDIQEGMVNEECKNELARLKEEMAELTDQMKKFDSGEEYLLALEQYAFIHEKYEAEKEAWELEKESWSARSDNALGQLKANELVFGKIRSAFAIFRAEQDKKVTKDDGIKKEDGSDGKKEEKAIKADILKSLSDTLYNDPTNNREVISALEEEPKPTPKEESLQRIIASLQNELALSRRAWKIESGQQVELQRKLVAENNRLAQDLATEKEARNELGDEKSTLHIEGAKFDGTLVWVSDTYEEAEKKLKEELKELESQNEALHRAVHFLRIHAVEQEEMLAGLVARAVSKSLGGTKDSEALRNRATELNDILCGLAAEIRCQRLEEAKGGDGSLKDTEKKETEKDIIAESLSTVQAASEIVGGEGVLAAEIFEENAEKANAENVKVRATSEEEEKLNVETVQVEGVSAVKESGEKGGSEKGRLSMIFGAFRTKVGRHT